MEHANAVLDKGGDEEEPRHMRQDMFRLAQHLIGRVLQGVDGHAPTDGIAEPIDYVEISEFPFLSRMSLHYLMLIDVLLVSVMTKK